jgi:hypothetical protein
MGKRTSDALAIVAILSGAGLGLGLTGLAFDGVADTALDSDSSMRIQIVRHGMDGIDGDVTVRASHRAPNAYMMRRMRESGRDRARMDRLMIRSDELLLNARGMEELDAEEIKRLETQTEALRTQIGQLELSEIAAMLQSGKLEAMLEDLGLESLSIDVRRDGEDQKRRRRRRRPRRVVDVPGVDVSAN